MFQEQDIKELSPFGLRFVELWEKIGAESDGEKMFWELSALYSNPQRKYHNFDHIQDCLLQLETVRGISDDPLALEVAIWFHDAIYNPSKKDNEEQSALYAYEKLKVGEVSLEFTQKVKELILATKHLQSQKDHDFQFMVDIDLTNLAVSFEEFVINTQKIREEYTGLSDKDFKRGRAVFLRSMLTRERIYYSDYFFQRYEIAARKNLQESIVLLES